MVAATVSEGSATPAKGRSRLPILLAAGVAVLLAAGGAAAWFLGGAALLGAGEEHAAAEEAPASGRGGHEPEKGAPKVTFLDLPDLLVNLASDHRRPRYLKLKITLEVADEASAREVVALAPRVMDSFQGYLRALRIEDVDGARGMQVLKEELLARVNLAIRPARVEDVLFKEILLQ